MTSSTSPKASNHATLDLFSTSPTTAAQERRASTSPCIYNAPFFAYQTEQKTWHITQGNCHHWDCPRCGLGRAKQEYGRMVNGCRTLAEAHDLYFITITCRGKEITHEYAEQNYGKWTNTLLDACRVQAKRKKHPWYYVQVTERQRRLHPHSHFITTYCPTDAKTERIIKYKVGESGKRENANIPPYVRHGLQSKLLVLDLVNSMKSRKLKIQRPPVDMSPSISSSPPFSRIVGLQDGSASGTVKAFLMRRNAKE